MVSRPVLADQTRTISHVSLPAAQPKAQEPGRRKRTGPRNSCRPLSTDRARLEILHDLVKLLCSATAGAFETVTPCAIGLAYFWRKVPETKGRSLEEIERDLAVDPGAVESVRSATDPSPSHACAVAVEPPSGPLSRPQSVASR